MQRLSDYLLPTERDDPADAEAKSHRLMVRAGLIRQIGAGLWSWMPSGWRVHQRICDVIRDEMEAIGGQEVLMPVLLPAEPWKRTGRHGISELFKLEDRKGAEMVLAMTHEEAVTSHVAQIVRSYRDLPLILWHLQTKERDEPRPRAGVLRTREFIMKDSYSFDRDDDGLALSYSKHIEAYDRIFDRCGLEWYRVESDVGMMGGSGAHEYMAPCAAGENEVALAPGYAANVEVASADPQPVELPDPLPEPEEVSTPGATAIEDVASLLGVLPGALLKSFPVISNGELVLAIVRGDHQVNEIKLANALGGEARPAHTDEIEKALGPVGFIGPVGAQVRVILDSAVGPGGWITGANRPDLHLRGVEPGRDFQFERGDIRSVVEGDTVNGHPIRIEPAIEIGNIFKLGTRYSEALGATFLDEAGNQRPIIMGSYGIGPARIAAAAVEQRGGDTEIPWPRAIAPWDVEIVAIGKPESDEVRTALEIAAELDQQGLSTVVDDRDSSPGAKFADADLIGCPLRLTVGRKGLERGVIEGRESNGAEHEFRVDQAASQAAVAWRAIP
ncbi:MAG: proline--tRNA ligase [Actinomycetes bacterium]